MSSAPYPVLLLAMLLAHSSAEAAGNDKILSRATQKIAANTGKTGLQQKSSEHCAQESQNCDARIRSGRSRADAASRDHHSEGHHDHGAEGQQ